MILTENLPDTKPYFWPEVQVYYNILCKIPYSWIFFDKSMIHVFLIDSFMNQLNWCMEINKTSNSNDFCYWRFDFEMLLMHLWSCSHTQELWQWHVSKFVLMILSFRNLSDQWKAFPQGFFKIFYCQLSIKWTFDVSSRPASTSLSFSRSLSCCVFQWGE